MTSVDATTGVTLELDDIQAGALYERPSPYVGTYLLLRIRDRADGRELVRRLHRIVNPAGAADTPDDTSLTVAFTYHGLKALGVPQASLDSFAPEFRQGMAARAEILGDVGESAPEHWEKPLGTADVHVAIAVLSSDEAQLRRSRREGPRRPRRASRGRADLASGLLPARHRAEPRSASRTASANPPSRAAADPPRNPRERPLKAGEIILGYPDETGELPPMPTPEVLGRNGTYVVFRKLHTKVAAYRSYLRDQGSEPRARRTSSARRWSGAGRAARRSHSLPTRTTRSSGATRGATTTSSSPMTRAASSARWVPTPAGPTRATHWTTTAAWMSGSTG